jgi:hypothetical protein
MNLLQLRNEVLGHGFDPIVFSGRINQYLNDALNLVCVRVNYYGEEAVYTFSTTTGTAVYNSAPDTGRIRSLLDTGRQMELESVTIREIDRSASTQGAPAYYAMDGLNFHLYPTPDGVYSLEERYWKTPAQLVNDTDVPILPATWHRLLWYWAVRECYAAEDDAATAQYWEQQFNTALAELAADVKFPDTDRPAQAKGMWESDRPLDQRGWALWGY